MPNLLTAFPDIGFLCLWLPFVVVASLLVCVGVCAVVGGRGCVCVCARVLVFAAAFGFCGFACLWLWCALVCGGGWVRVCLRLLCGLGGLVCLCVSARVGARWAARLCFGACLCGVCGLVCPLGAWRLRCVCVCVCLGCCLCVLLVSGVT